MVNFQILVPTVLCELHKTPESDETVLRLSEYLGDLSLMCIDIRQNFDAVEIAKACRIVAKVALGLPRSTYVFAGQRVEECSRQVRSMWMEFSTPGHFTNRFQAIANKYTKYGITEARCPSYLPPLSPD